MSDLLDARDLVWDSLASSPLRRAMLGRERCDAIVSVALEALATESQLASGAPLLARVEDRVRRRYRENAGMAFMTLLVVWAISSIVQVLVIRWLNRRG